MKYISYSYIFLVTLFFHLAIINAWSEESITPELATQADRILKDNKELLETEENIQEKIETTKEEKKDLSISTTTEKDKPTDNKDKKKKDTVEVEEASFFYGATFDAVIGTTEHHTVAIESDHWNDFSVKEVLEHGSKLEEGDVMIQFCDESYQLALTEQKLKTEKSSLALEVKEKEFNLAKKTAQLDKAKAENEVTLAKENIKHFEEIRSDMLKKLFKYMVKHREEQLSYKEEELEQLLKMYEADDLIEDTEEMIVTRAKNGVALAKFQLEQQISQTTLQNSVLKRDIDALNEKLKRTELALLKIEETSNRNLEIKKIDLQSATNLHQKEQKRLKELESDKQWLEIKSPIDGILIWGKIKDAKWNQNIHSKLKKHGKLMRNEIVFSILPHSAGSKLVGFINPDKRPHVLSSEDALITLPSEIPVITKNIAISDIPESDGRFRITLEGVLPESAVAGLKVKVQIPASDAKEEVIAIPNSAVDLDVKDGEVIYQVMLEDETYREIIVGRQNRDQTEVISGLDVGEKIFKKIP